MDDLRLSGKAWITFFENSYFNSHDQEKLEGRMENSRSSKKDHKNILKNL